MVLNSYNGQSKKWVGQPTHMRWRWVCFYNSARELMEELLDHDVIHYDDIEDYGAEENDIEKCDVYSEPKDLEEYHEKIYELLSEMGDNEIEYMISCQTGNAYYQDFLKLDENGNEIEVETMAKTSEAKMRANKKYEKAHIRQILLKFHKTHDAAIIEKLDSLDSKNNYVRQLILKDLEREKKEANNK